ncbi:SxtJ family membrane protein [Elusimicrobiota bacterium]
MTKRHSHPSLKDLRVFGVGLGVVLSVFGALAWRKAAPSMPYLFAVAAVMALWGLIAPGSLVHVYRPWMKVVGVIGAINQFLLMGLVFYLIITPYSMVLKLLGKDLLDERLNTGESYWKAREPITDPKAYERQF